MAKVLSEAERITLVCARNRDTNKPGMGGRTDFRGKENWHEPGQRAWWQGGIQTRRRSKHTLSNMYTEVELFSRALYVCMHDGASDIKLSLNGMINERSTRRGSS